MEPTETTVHHTPQVGFPEAPKKKSGSPLKWVVLALGILVIVGGGGYFIMKSSEEDGAPKASATPTGALSALATSTPAPQATSTPKASEKPVDKKTVKVEVQNGTGTPGDAAFLKDALTKLGYTDIDTGNADSQTETTTTVTFDRDLSETVVKEITTELERLYTEVTTKKSTLAGDLSVRVVTGTKKSGSATKTATPKASGTPKASATPTKSPTATKSPSPTPTN